jgi:uncharacterized membrane protein YdjX (TVP38/TMEM64 family)
LNLTSIIEAATHGYPLLSSFLVAFISNAIPYMTVPYLAVIAGYGAIINDFLNRLLIAVAGGLGAAAGKVIVFMLGRGVHHVLPEHLRENVSFIAKVFSKGVFIAIFMFAALPLPDDLLYIPVGMTGYSLFKFFVAVASGKIVLTLAAVLAGGLVGELTGGSSSPWVIVGLALLGIVASIITIRADWKRVVILYNERGAVRATVELFVQLIVGLLPRQLARRVEEKVDSVLGGIGEPQGQAQSK